MYEANAKSMFVAKESHLAPPFHKPSLRSETCSTPLLFLIPACSLTLKGELSKTLELVDETSRLSSNPDRIMACEVWGDGVVALLSSGRMKAISGIHGAEPRRVRAGSLVG